MNANDAIKKKILKLYPQADTNGDGMLSAAEEAALSRKVLKRYPKADANGDGVLSDAEKQTLLRRAAARAKRKAGSVKTSKRKNPERNRGDRSSTADSRRPRLDANGCDDLVGVACRSHGRTVGACIDRHRKPGLAGFLRGRGRGHSIGPDPSNHPMVSTDCPSPRSCRRDGRCEAGSRVQAMPGATLVSPFPWSRNWLAGNGDCARTAGSNASCLTIGAEQATRQDTAA